MSSDNGICKLCNSTREIRVYDFNTNKDQVFGCPICIEKEKDAELERLRGEMGQIKDRIEFADAMFSACCYLDRAVPVFGRANPDRVRFAADEIIRLRGELVSIAEWASMTDCFALDDKPEKRAMYLVQAMVSNRDLKIKQLEHQHAQALERVKVLIDLCQRLRDQARAADLINIDVSPGVSLNRYCDSVLNNQEGGE